MKYTRVFKLLFHSQSVAFLCVLSVTAAAAERKTVRLTSSLNALEASCPAESELKDLVSARLGYDPFQAHSDELATVTVSTKEGRLTGTVELTSKSGISLGVREVQGSIAGCEALVKTLALNLAIAIDPQVLLKPQTSPTVIDPTPVSAPPPPPRAPGASGLSPISFSGRASAIVTWAQLPSFAPGFSLEARGRIGAFSLGLEGALFPNSAFAFENALVTTSLLRGAMSACGHFSWFAVCARGAGGALRANGRGFDIDRRGILPVATVGPMLAFEPVFFSHWVVRFGLGLDVALIRNSLFVGNTEIWNAAPFSVEAQVSLGWTSL